MPCGRRSDAAASSAAVVDEVISLDARRREAIERFETLRAEQNRVSQSIARAKKDGEDASAAIAEMQQVAAEVKELALERDAVDARAAAASREPSEPRRPGRAARGHDRPRGGRRVEDRRATTSSWPARGSTWSAAAKLSGARFAYLKGDLAILELALIRWAQDKLAGHGFEHVIPPVLVREEALYGTGMLPDTEQQLYRLADDDLYLVGTSEVALASLHAGEIVDELPIRYAGFSTCFRREAGAAGKDTRGIFRVHQFDKLEMFAFVEPDASPDEHLRLLAIEEEILGDLGIPYRVVDIAVDDLGAPAARKFDCEAWLPGQGRYRELTSCSNTTDFQARRLDIRFRPEGGKPETLHTLNGTAVAVGRTIIALLENGQQEDGSIAMPAVLEPYGVPSVLPSAVAAASPSP